MGFRFTTVHLVTMILIYILPDKIIVISGDASPSEKITEYASGADILIHEVYYKKAFDTKTELWKNYHARHHTSTIELADIADKAQPKLVVLYHILFWGATDEDMINEISTKYKGKVIVAKDLDIY